MQVVAVLRQTVGEHGVERSIHFRQLLYDTRILDIAVDQGSATKTSIVVSSAWAIRASVAAEPGLSPRSISDR